MFYNQNRQSIVTNHIDNFKIYTKHCLNLDFCINLMKLFNKVAQVTSLNSDENCEILSQRVIRINVPALPSCIPLVEAEWFLK